MDLGLIGQDKFLGKVDTTTLVYSLISVSGCLFSDFCYVGYY